MPTARASQSTQLMIRPAPAKHAAQYVPGAKGEEKESGFERIVVVRVGECSGAGVRNGEAKSKEQT
jgi:hypothetical protein